MVFLVGVAQMFPALGGLPGPASPWDQREASAGSVAGWEVVSSPSRSQGECLPAP